LRGTNPVTAVYRYSRKRRETAMNIAKLVLAGTAALTITGLAVTGSAALAQQDQAAQHQKEQTGQVTKINRLNSTIAIRPVQSGTVGANGAAAEQEFKVKDGVSLDDLHAGNRITYSTSGSVGDATVTKFKVQ
jgi:Cu/Ag efflux protein CusF